MKTKSITQKGLFTKIIACVLGVMIIGASAFVLTSCGNEKQTADKKSTSSDSAEKNTEDSTEEAAKTELKSLGDFNKEPTIEKTVLVDNKQVKITATSLDYDNYQANVSLEFKNKTKEELTITSGTAAYSANSVNGYMVNEYLNCDVPKNGKAEDKISFGFSELNVYGITEIYEMELAFTVMTEDFDDVQTAPAQIKTSIYGDYEKDTFKKAAESSAILDGYGVSVKKAKYDEALNKNGISVVSEVLATNKDGETSLILEFANDTEKQMKLTVNDLAVDGEVITESYAVYTTINPNKRAAEIASLSSENEIATDKIKTISFTVSVNDKDYNYILEDEKVEISF